MMMKRQNSILVTALMGAMMSVSFAENSTDKTTLWYDQEARDWETEALPIGNGRLGAMLFGGVFMERIQFNEDSLWIGDESDTGAYQAFGDLFVSIHEKKHEGQFLQCSSGQIGAGARNEGIANSIDNDPKTKWCIAHEGRPVQWTLQLNAPQVLNEYSLTSANDKPSRDPKQWTWEGSKDGVAWEQLDAQDLEAPFTARREKKTFSFENDTAYKYYRFSIQKNHGDHRLYQLSEVTLPGITVTPEQCYEPGSELTNSYRRELDLATAVHKTSYELEGVNYTRESFSSRPSEVIVFRYDADKPGSYSGKITLKDMHEGHVSVTGNQIVANGNVEGYQFSGYGDHVRKDYNINLEYESRVKVLNQGGELTVVGDSIEFTNCDSLTVFLAADTDYLNERSKGWKKEHPSKELQAQLDEASKKSYSELREEHVASHQSIFNLVSMDLGGEHANIPTDELLKNYKSEQNPALEALLFQYARYLMISCSRPGTMPANLQGLWNQTNNPPWRGDYHTDVNLEMNYWFVDAANLPGCFEPLADWVYSIREVRKEATKKQFGIDRGWMLQAENGIFGGGSAFWSKGDAAWIAQNLFAHYAFTQDKDYLQNRLYPVLKELCELWQDGLKEMPDGTLVIPDGYSPEHGPREDGVSFDQQLVYNLFSNYLVASKDLGVDAEFRKVVSDMRSRLLAPQIGRWGQLQEWMVDRDDPDNKHRHVSHMIAVYPGHQISPTTTPELAEAAIKSLDARGDGSTGWSRAWKTSIWARLHDGNRAYSIMNGLVSTKIYKNLFATHPPFQIDANFGFAAGVCEMLIQSHTGEIQILPAIPDAWSEGDVKGLRARGDYTVSMQWAEGELVQAEIHAGPNSNGRVTVTYGGRRQVLELAPGDKKVMKGSDF